MSSAGPVAYNDSLICNKYTTEKCSEGHITLEGKSCQEVAWRLLYSFRDQSLSSKRNTEGKGWWAVNVSLAKLKVRDKRGRLKRREQIMTDYI